MENFRSLRFIVKNIFKILFIIFMSFEMFRIFLPFLLILIIAILLALAAEPVVVKLENKFKWPRVRVVVLLLTASFFLIALPIALFGLKGVHLVSDNLIPYLSQDKQQSDLLIPVKQYIAKVANIFNVDPDLINSKAGEAMSSILAFIARLFKTLVAQIPDIAFSAILFAISLGVFMSYFQQCKRFLAYHSNMKRENFEKLFVSIAESSRLIFVSNFITGLVQASIVTLGALFCGFHEVFLIFFITFICSFFPVLGTAPVSLVLSAIGFFNGEIGVGITMLVVAGITGVSDNVVRPLTMMSGDNGLHPFISLLSVIGGVIVYGIPGLLLGPLIASICYTCIPIVIDDLLTSDEIKQ